MKRLLARHLKLQHLRVIAGIERHGSLRQAALALGLSQPALTRTLHEIELLVGAPLFERSTRGVTPNARGARLLASARRILTELAELDQDLGDASAADEWVAVGALPAAAVGLLPGVLQRMRGKAPASRLRVLQGQTEELLTALSTGEVDLVVGRVYPTPTADAFDRQVLYQDAVAVLARASHPLFAAGGDPLEGLQRYPLALPSRTRAGATEIDVVLKRFATPPLVQVESNSLPLVRELLLTSDMLTVMPRMMLAGDLLRGAVREIAVLPVEGGRPCGLITRRHARLGPTAQHFISALRAELALLDAPPVTANSAPHS
ncbi:MAG: LysR substrate-binding domain-containing protein [Steroidobacteraceae bacterium]